MGSSPVVKISTRKMDRVDQVWQLVKDFEMRVVFGLL